MRKDKARSRTRVNIGSAFQRWRTQGVEGLRSDAEVALYLLDRGVTLDAPRRDATAKVCLHWTRVFQPRM